MDEPLQSTLDDYARMPVSSFGEALFRGMSASSGTKRKPTEAYMPKARPSLLGIGAKPLADTLGLPARGGQKKGRGGNREGYKFVPLVRRESESKVRMGYYMSSLKRVLSPDGLCWFRNRRRRLASGPCLLTLVLPPNNVRHVGTGRSGTTRTVAVVAGATTLVVTETGTMIVTMTGGESIGRRDTTIATEIGTGISTATDGESEMGTRNEGDRILGLIP
jgi:G-patch domain